MEFVYKSERTNNKIQKICEIDDLSDLKQENLLCQIQKEVILFIMSKMKKFQCKIINSFNVKRKYY